MDTHIGVHGERSPVEEARLIEPELKRALYQCLERIHATKAALYLSTKYAGRDAFELLTSYGWGAPPARPALDERNPIVARLGASRAPLVVNSPAADQRVAELLFEQGCERVLAVAIFGRERLVGIIDLRDKAAKKPFDSADVAAADSVRAEIEKLLAAKSLYGLGGTTIVDAPKRPRGPSAKYSAVMRAEAALLPETVVRADTTPSPGALEVIRAARDRIGRRALARDAARRLLSREELERLRVVLPAVLAIPGVVAGVLTNITQRERQIVVSNAPLADDALRLINDRLAASLKRREVAMAASRANWSAVPQSNAITAGDIRIVASAAVAPKSVDGLVLTVALATKPTDEARVQIERLAEQLGAGADAILGRSAWPAQRGAAAPRTHRRGVARAGFPRAADSAAALPPRRGHRPAARAGDGDVGGIRRDRARRRARARRRPAPPRLREARPWRAPHRRADADRPRAPPRRRRARRALPRTRRRRRRPPPPRALRRPRLPRPPRRRAHPPRRARRPDRRLLRGHDLARVIHAERRPRRSDASTAEGRGRAVRSVAGGDVYRRRG